MRVWAAHAVFAAILVASLASREQSVEPIPDDTSLERAVIRVAGQHGWDFREYRTTSGMFSRTLVFAAPGCSQPVRVGLRLSTFEDEALSESAPGPGYVRRYAYFDRIWDTPEPRAAFIQRMKYAALAPFGLTEYTPSRHLLEIEAPANCPAAEAIDWRSVWNREELAAQAATAAAPKR